MTTTKPHRYFTPWQLRQMTMAMEERRSRLRLRDTQALEMQDHDRAALMPEENQNEIDRYTRLIAILKAF